MKTVPLHGRKAAGRVVLVDDEDYNLVMQYRWNIWEVAREGRPNGPYAIANIRRDDHPTTILMHKLITGWPMTDHINHDGLDNRRVNLRPATRGQNGANQRAQIDHSSIYKGVHWFKASRKWQVRITVDGKRRHLGFHVLEEDAARAYDAAAVEAFGQYACLNFPPRQAALFPSPGHGRDCGGT